MNKLELPEIETQLFYSNMTLTYKIKNLIEVLAAPLIILLSVFSLSITLNEAHSSQAPAEKKSVQLVKVEEKSFADQLIYPARLDYQSKALLRSPIAGEIEWQGVGPGSSVKKGQLLALIKNNDPLFNYRAARVVSSMDGMLAETKVGNLSEVAKEQPVAILVRPDQILATIEIPAEKLSLFSNKKKGDLFGELELEGMVNKLPLKQHGLVPYVDPATGTAKDEFFVELNLKNAAEKELVLAGRLARAHFKGQEINGLVVPESSLNFKGRDTYVGVVENNIYRRRVIEVASKKDGFVLIKSGLKKDEMVVTRASGMVKDGSSVEIIKN